NAGGFGGGGTGILEDVAGDDRYISVATSEATARAVDERTDPPPGARATSLATAAQAEAVSQAIGSLGGAGFLLDHSGNDSYDSRTSSVAAAESTSAGSSDASAESALAISRAQAVGITGGYGELRDAGGTDAYRSTNISSATANPPVSETPGQARSSVQGSADLQPVQGLDTIGGFASFADLDGGPPDVLAAVPADAACQGSRGQAAWRDCGRELAVGLVA
ncbi:MAG TPA: hypothetical protein VG602_07845, partial [Actinomycetota bacterium]|nr:hypothetical protein [Actinomycetota bacterium]